MEKNRVGNDKSDMAEGRFHSLKFLHSKSIYVRITGYQTVLIAKQYMLQHMRVQNMGRCCKDTYLLLWTKMFWLKV